MKEINWKSLSLSLISSTIVNGTILSILLIWYTNTMSVLFHEILSHINNSNVSGKTAYTIAYGKPIPVWGGILIFSMSFVVITTISYLIIESLKQRKK